MANAVAIVSYGLRRQKFILENNASIHEINESIKNLFHIDTNFHIQLFDDKDNNYIDLDENFSSAVILNNLTSNQTLRFRAVDRTEMPITATNTNDQKQFNADLYENEQKLSTLSNNGFHSTTADDVTSYKPVLSKHQNLVSDISQLHTAAPFQGNTPVSIQNSLLLPTVNSLSNMLSSSTQSVIDSQSRLNVKQPYEVTAAPANCQTSPNNNTQSSAKSIQSPQSTTAEQKMTIGSFSSRSGAPKHSAEPSQQQSNPKYNDNRTDIPSLMNSFSQRLLPSRPSSTASPSSVQQQPGNRPLTLVPEPVIQSSTPSSAQQQRQHQQLPATTSTVNVPHPQIQPNRSFDYSHSTVSSFRSGINANNNQSYHHTHIPTIDQSQNFQNSNDTTTMSKTTPNPFIASTPMLNQQQSDETHSVTVQRSKPFVPLQRLPPDTIIKGTVVVASNPSYFFIQILDQGEFKLFSDRLIEYYNNIDINPRYLPEVGEFCVAKYTEDLNWYRCRVVRYTSKTSVEVFYIDYGNIEDLPLELLRELDYAFSKMPAMAIACTVAEILPTIGSEGWSRRATYAFSTHCFQQRVEATVVDTTERWPMHFVRIRLSNGQDLASILDSCKIARRVTNEDISVYWASKIRIEQYILYNNDEMHELNFPIQVTPLSSSSSSDLAPVVDEQQQDEEVELPNALSSLDLGVKQNELNNAVNIDQENGNDDETSLKQNNKYTASIDERIETTNVDLARIFINVDTRNRDDNAKFIDDIDDNEDVIEKQNTIDEDEISTTKISEEILHQTKKEVFVSTTLTSFPPLAKAWIPVEIAHIETPARFYIRYVYGPGFNLGNSEIPILSKEKLEKNVILNEMTRDMTECYNKHKRLVNPDMFNQGQIVAVKYQSEWHRGRYLQFKPNIQFADVFFVDHGFTRSVPVQMIRQINHRYTVQPFQAHLGEPFLISILHLNLPLTKKIDWTSDDFHEFKQLSMKKILYSRIIYEPDIIDLLDYNRKTKIWFSFKNHFLSKHS
ncbi:unnamed protein product [Didymodactylos carnosus]|uniref:Tudor domain-containing protein n=1 Tax=Didymodactylos carnosus TaxID=1234261 RepID=A0A8S2CX79_9BILA|nr:unnamed protein product [Didymodactylos carnosus]CAF3610954.1 unnamed protein product [Didymodactylos carnosus]